MRLRQELHPDDLAAIRTWFGDLSTCVQAIDYEAAFPLFAEDMIAFGTFSDFVMERDAAVREQWGNVWPTIRNFRFRLDGVHGIVAGDRLTGVGMGVWDSDGFLADGTRFDRRGRTTVVLGRETVGAPWVATHTHMSLFRGTPDRSHGKFD